MQNQRGKTRRDALAIGLVLLASPALAAEDAAARICRKSIVLDGNLIASSLFEQSVIDAATAARIRSSGLTALKQTLGDTSAGFADTQSAIQELSSAITRNNNLFTQITSADQIAEVKRVGKIGIIFSFEAASMHEGRITNINHFAGLGVRVMGLSYNRGSSFGGGSLQGAEVGLTPLGREAVARMVALGVTVDISHSNEATGFEAVTAAKTPVLLTHAGAAAVHSHPRNKSDRLLKAVADSGGVIGVYDLSYLGNYPANPTVDTYMDHLTHALNVCGEDHVGIGSDSFLLGMDTSPDAIAGAERNEAARKASGIAAPEELAIPFVTGLNGPDRYEVICRALLQRGYHERTAQKVLGTNFARVFAETWSNHGIAPR